MPAQHEFDFEAATFDARAGLPPEALAGAVAAIRRFLPPTGLGALLDVGAGTGALGGSLSGRAGFYVALDVSRPMLQAFARRRPPAASPRALLIQADAATPWPVRARCFDVVFASRAFHRFPLRHALDEVFRAAVPGGVFLLGGIRRAPGSEKSVLKGLLHAALRRRGLEPRDAEGNVGEALEICRARGARVLQPITAARWTAAISRAKTIAGWRAREGLAGLRLEKAIKGEILKEVEGAQAHVAEPAEEEESYVLEGARLA